MLSLYSCVILALAHVNALPVITPITTPLATPAVPCTWCTASSAPSAPAAVLPSLATKTVASSIAGSSSLLPVTADVAGTASVAATIPSVTPVLVPIVADVSAKVSALNATVDAKVDSAVAVAGNVVADVSAKVAAQVDSAVVASGEIIADVAANLNASLKAEVDPTVNATLVATKAALEVVAATHLNTSASASASVSLNLAPQVNALVNLLTLCNTLSVSLNALVGKVGSTSVVVGGMVNANLVSALTGLNGFVEISVNSIKAIGTVADAQLQIMLYSAFKLMANSVLQSCNSVASQKTLLITQKAALHAALLKLQVSVHAMTDALFGGCIPVALDVSNIRAALYVSLQAAVNATA